jgi:ribonuclease-3
MKEKWAELQERLGVRFQNPELLRQAFIHRSYLNENPKEALDHNERLEFLGDAVLELVVTEHLYRSYPNPEGELTTWRAALVNAQTMGEIASDLGFNEYLLLSRGEAKDTGRARQVILANTLEAVIGALYLDQGYEATRDFSFRHIIERLPDIITERRYRDPKSLFQEAAQEREGVTPTYQILQESGPDHAKVFNVGVYLGDALIAEGSGSSKQEAEQEAARRGLETKGWVS